MANIKVIPPQMGNVSKYTTRALRQGPLWLLFKDTIILITVLPYLPLLFFPLKSKNGSDQSQWSFASILGNIVQALLCLVETVLLVAVFPALISIPAILFVAAAIASVLLIKLIAWPTQGPRVIKSKMDADTLKLAMEHKDERWIFINGICTGSSGLQQNVDRLSLLFGRSVVGIHNQSYGMIGDLLECILQRCLDYKTMDVRVAYEIVNGYLTDPEAKKVVLIAHSQGGIIASMLLDHLFPELPGELISKLEIYTFGSAASHFHNPSITFSDDVTQSPPHCIRHIEHYANEKDMVPRWGVLYATSTLLQNRYAGKVFVRMGAMGHLFVPHYLDPIFPLPRKAAPKKAQATEHDVASGGVARVQQVNSHTVNEHAENSQTRNGDIENGHVEEPHNAHDMREASSYLNAIATVDKQVPMERNYVRFPPLMTLKNRQQMGWTIDTRSGYTTMTNGVMRSTSGNGRIDGVSFEMRPNSEETGEAVFVQGTTCPAVSNAAEYRGKTVKDISRLWKYLGGNSPAAE
ncbi:MAG: hypothetical protein Q9201_005233 [Fulgogasparrea decipioides]